MVVEAASANVWWAVVIRKLWDLSKMLGEQTKLWAVPGTGVYVKEVWSHLCPTFLSWPFCKLLYNPRAQPGILEGLRRGLPLKHHANGWIKILLIFTLLSTCALQVSWQFRMKDTRYMCAYFKSWLLYFLELQTYWCCVFSLPRWLQYSGTDFFLLLHPARFALESLPLAPFFILSSKTLANVSFLEEAPTGQEIFCCMTDGQIWEHMMRTLKKV